MSKIVLEYRELEEETKKLIKHHLTTRQLFKHLKNKDIKKTSLRFNLSQLKNPIKAKFKFSREIDSPTIEEMNSVAHYLNQNVIVRFYALLEDYKVIGEKIKICKDYKGWEELDILRRLRNKFAHSSGKLDLSDSDQKQLYNRMIDHFKLTEGEFDSSEFPLPSKSVIMEIFDACLRYSRELLESSSNAE